MDAYDTPVQPLPLQFRNKCTDVGLHGIAPYPRSHRHPWPRLVQRHSLIPYAAAACRTTEHRTILKNPAFTGMILRDEIPISIAGVGNHKKRVAAYSHRLAQHIHRLLRIVTLGVPTGMVAGSALDRRYHNIDPVFHERHSRGDFAVIAMMVDGMERNGRRCATINLQQAASILFDYPSRMHCVVHVAPLEHRLVHKRSFHTPGGTIGTDRLPCLFNRGMLYSRPVFPYA